ncbi:MAG: hypothetical protein JSV19_13690 [Phycisphaerales bacterium]|nr:MAG: hypothetical protein JSV19_13690 [Phycisphaerales bacterium]
MNARQANLLDNHNWPFNGRTVIAFSIFLVAYVTLAQWTGFHLVAWPSPGQGWIDHRAGELTVLWTVGFVFLFAVRWFAQKCALSPTTRTWHIIYPPLVAGCARSALRMWDFASEGVPKDWVTRQPDRVLVSVKALLAVTPALGGCVCCLVMWWLIRGWKRWHRTGHRCRCGYDLTGNVSGICPECGTPIERKSTDPVP